MLATRELGELPLVVWLASSRRARRARVTATANVLGKAATALQLAAVTAALVGARTDVWVASASAMGVVAAVSYWWHAVHAVHATA
jgi:hypothetical protein